jgi:Domain of unknown function (DUF3303)
MKFLLQVKWDIEAGNALARSGKLGSAVEAYLAEHKPEVAYFYAVDGNRGGIMIVDMKDASQIPALAEPWFLMGNAKVEFFPVMAPADLAKAGPSIEAAVKKFG